MEIVPLEDALKTTLSDPTAVADVVWVWPHVRKVLGDASTLMTHPLWLMVNGHLVDAFGAMFAPEACRVQLQGTEGERRCLNDAATRAADADLSDHLTCHAAMPTFRRTIATGSPWSLTVLLGPTAAAGSDEWTAPTDTQVQFLGGIAELLETVLRMSAGYQTSAIGMAHEVSHALVGLGAALQLLDRKIIGAPGVVDVDADTRTLVRLAFSEARLSLYVIRNFLSNASEHEYAKVSRRRNEVVDLASVIEDMVMLHRPSADRRGVAVDLELPALPRIHGDELELRRLLHNLLSNAIKYSYHSTERSERAVVVRARVPYDPGFRERRLAISIENYGLGLDDGEIGQLGTPGFRGRRARAEVPIGSGLGLSETRKIAKLHGGEVKIRMRRLYDDPAGQPVALVRVQVILPY